MVDTDAENKKRSLPPYIAFKTLLDLVGRMADDGLPTRVDGSYLESYAGGYRPTVIGNLQTLRLLNTANEPTELLKQLVEADEDRRKQLVGTILRDTYPDVLALPQNSTQQQFLDAFGRMGAQGDTKRKAVGFFLKAAVYAGVPTGRLWKTPASSASGASRRKTKTPPPADPPAQLPPAGEPGESVIVDLGAAGSVTVQVDVRWLQLDDDTFVALRKVVNDLKALRAEAAPESVTAPSGGFEDPVETSERDDTV